MAGKNGKLLIAAIALLSAAGRNLYAEPYLFTSPQKTATVTQFWSDADLFLSPYGYTDVEFNKFFGVISFQNEHLSKSGQTNMMQAGVAAKFGGLYTALYYGGNTLAVPNQVYREDENGTRIYAEWPKLTEPPAKIPYNEASVLIGAADMGFRLSFFSTYNSYNLKEFYLGASTTPPWETVKSYQSEYGNLNPQIAWGMAKELIPGKGLKPHLYIDLDFFRDYQKYDKGVGEVINRSYNDFTLGLTAATGAYSLVKINDFDFGVDLWYTLTLKTFDNEYTPKKPRLDSSGNPVLDANNKPVLDPVYGTKVSYKGVSVDDYYRTGYTYNELSPYLYAAWSNDKVSLSAELDLLFGLENEKGSQYNMDGESPRKDGDDFEANTFLFSPGLLLGLQWAIVPDKFFLNAGGDIKFFDLRLKTKTINQYANDSKTGDPAVKAIDNTFDGASTKLYLGITFNPTPNLGIQAMSGVGINTNQISVFDSDTSMGKTGGLAVFSQIMATVKF